MSDFFHGWRRKAGCVALVIALAFVFYVTCILEYPTSNPAEILTPHVANRESKLPVLRLPDSLAGETTDEATAEFLTRSARPLPDFPSPDNEPEWQATDTPPATDFTAQEMMNLLSSLSIKGKSFTDASKIISAQSPSQIQWADCTRGSKLPRQIDRDQASRVMKLQTPRMRAGGNAIYFALVRDGEDEVVEMWVRSH